MRTKKQMRKTKLEKLTFYWLPVAMWTAFGVYVSAVYLSVQFLYGGK